MSKPGVPAGFSTVTPHLVVRDAAQAIEFYKKAFGAKETVAHGRTRWKNHARGNQNRRFASLSG